MERDSIIVAVDALRWLGVKQVVSSDYIACTYSKGIYSCHDHPKGEARLTFNSNTESTNCEYDGSHRFYNWKELRPINSTLCGLQ